MSTATSSTPEVEVIPPAARPLTLPKISLTPGAACFAWGLAAGLIGGVALVWIIRKRL